MKLKAEPVIALCDEKIDISISGLPAGGKVRIDASMCFPWAAAARFESFAVFTADTTGTVDLSKHKPDSGSYEYVDSMGLIASCTCKDPKAFGKIGKNVSLDKNLFIDITARCEQDTANVKLERLFKVKEIQRQRITDEFVGELFYTENTDSKTVMFLGGSGSGNLDLLSLYAAPLASHGFNVLAVAYYGEKGLPAELAQVPLEYFDKVFAWLSKHPATRGKEINLYCVSKGAELGLILASKYPFIAKVAACAPHAYCFQGLKFTKAVSSWTDNGKPLPFIRWKNRWFFGYIVSCFIKNKPFGFTYLYRKMLQNAKNKDEARIKIENAKADFLFFTSKDCNMWNTYEGSLELMETLRKSNYQHGYDLVVYDDAGEPYAPAYVIPYGEGKLEIAPRLVLSTGGTTKGNAHAQADSWYKAIEFLKR
jgi:hypothetical protein